MSYFGKKSVQNYLTTHNLKRTWKASDSYDEPTYLGFKIEFVFNDFDSHFSNNLMPHGLLDTISQGNATEYLTNINQGRRAEMLKEFNELLYGIQKNSPWVFTEVTGLSDIYKINPTNSYRAQDKKITIKFHETLDNRVSYLLDLYRKIAFDAVNMKWILPDIMRFFKMNIYISEIRSFHQPVKKDPRSYSEDATKWHNSPSKLGSQFQEYGAQVASNWNDKKEKLLNTRVFPGQAAEAVKAGHFINYLDANTSIMRFEFSQCEFDINSFSLSALETAVENPDQPTSGEFSINVGMIRESNLWSLWDVILSDTNVNVDKGDLPRIDPNHKSDMHLYNRGENDNINSVYDAAPYLKNGNRHLGEGGGLGSSITENLLKELETIALSKSTDFVTETATKPVLGNIYGFSATQTAALLQGGLSGAITAISQFTNNNSGSSIGDNILGNAYQDFSDAYVPPPSSKSLVMESQNLPLGSVKKTNHAKTATDNQGDIGNVGFTGPPTK